jgi:hypothetical protein
MNGCRYFSAAFGITAYVLLKFGRYSPFWGVTAIGLFFGLLSLTLAIAPALRKDRLRGKCQRCGYNLRATPTDARSAPGAGHPDFS